MLALHMIAEAKSRNLTWAQIGSTMGMDAKAAKKHAKALARSTNARLLARDVAAAMSGETGHDWPDGHPL